MSKYTTRQFYAHSTDQPDRSNWQFLIDHLNGVGALAAENARYFGGADCARIAGQLHDIGKYTQEFQERLEGNIDRVDHATRGAVIATERYGTLGKLIAYGIAGHHAGLANGRDSGVRTSLKDRLRKDLPELDSAWEKEVTLDESPAPPPLKAKPGQQYFPYSFLGRMLFSCLVDADYLDTEAFYAGTDKDRSARDRNFPNLSALRDRLDSFIDGFKADTPVNQERAHILKHVRGQAG